MAIIRQPLFLARDSYRKRRLRDGARVLPIFGLILFLLPLMWPAVPQMVLAHWAFVFALWVALIGLAAILASGLGERETASSQEMANTPAPETHGAKAQGTAILARPPHDMPPDTPRALQNRP